jgi:ribonuclease T2
MRTSNLICCLLAVTLVSFIQGNELKNGADFCYVLAYSWTADFCGEKSYPGCEKPRDFWLTNFTLHGLWPQFTDSTGYPSFCDKDPYNPVAPEQVGMPKMLTYWPNVKSIEGDTNYGSFWEHEWSKHGTCTGLTQEGYFGSAIDLIIKYGSPKILSNAVGGSLSSDSLRIAMGGEDMVSLQCDGSQRDALR